MKRYSSLSIFFLLLLVLIVFAFQTVVLVNANPVWATFLPQYPDKNPPVVNISSPINSQICDVNNVMLNVTVAEPESWFRTNQYGDTKIGEVSRIRYSVDGEKNWTLYVGSISLSPLEDHPWNRSDKVFSVNLTGLTEGSHTLAVYAEGVTAFLPDKDEPFKVSSATVTSPPNIVVFAVTSTGVPTQEEGFSPNTAAAVIGTSTFAAVVAAAALIYWKKHKR